jgi:hypothetical protein
MALVHATTMAAPSGKPAYTDPAQTDTDFPFQGEYAGTLTINGQPMPFGVQVVALGNGDFNAVGYPGGLPGAGWTPPDKVVGQGARSGDATEVALHGVDWGGTTRRAAVRVIKGTPTVVVLDDAEGEIARLPKVSRTSPTLGQKPPPGAVVIFDGSNTDKLVGGRMTPDGLLMEGVTTKDTFGDALVHVEFRLPYQPEDRGQARGNSGAYVQGCYEVQMLDSFGLASKADDCGSVYSVAPPLVNMCLPPLAWQTYDIDFTAPRFDGDRKIANARMTVRHNGVVIQDDVDVPVITPSGPQTEEKPTGPLFLQNHRNPVRYRNIWVLPK